MSKAEYRIIKYTNKFYTKYKVQKKSFFGMWYNFNNVWGCSPYGYYDSESMAREAIERHRSKTVTEILILYPLKEQDND